MKTNTPPQLSPSLIEKLRTADLGAIADLFIEARTGVRRITAEEIGEIEPFAELPNNDPTPVYPVEPIARACDKLYVIGVQSRRRYSRRIFTFLATDDWKHLAVPTLILPPECLPDPVLRDYHWWQGRGAKSINSEESARALAKSIIRKFDGLDYDPSNPDMLNITFNVTTPKGVHAFMTRHGWNGLWCPLYMAEEGVKANERKAAFAKLLSEEAIRGKSAVTRYAMKYAKRWDKIDRMPPKRTTHEGPYRCYFIPAKHRQKLREYQRWLDATDVNGCSESRAIRYGIDLAHASMPRESEWNVVDHPLKDQDHDRTARAKGETRLDDSTVAKLPRRQREIIEAARAVANPGETVRIAELGDAVGIDQANAHKVVNALRRKGLWEYRSALDAESREEVAIRRIAKILSKFTDLDARRRVVSLGQTAARDAIGKVFD